MKDHWWEVSRSRYSLVRGWKKNLTYRGRAFLPASQAGDRHFQSRGRKTGWRWLPLCVIFHRNVSTLEDNDKRCRKNHDAGGWRCSSLWSWSCGACSQSSASARGEKQSSMMGNSLCNFTVSSCDSPPPHQRVAVGKKGGAIQNGVSTNTLLEMWGRRNHD